MADDLGSDPRALVEALYERLVKNMILRLPRVRRRPIALPSHEKFSPAEAESLGHQRLNGKDVIRYALDEFALQGDDAAQPQPYAPSLGHAARVVLVQIGRGQPPPFAQRYALGFYARMRAGSDLQRGRMGSPA